jgi:hypothetical protein
MMAIYSTNNVYNKLESAWFVDTQFGINIMRIIHIKLPRQKL